MYHCCTKLRFDQYNNFLDIKPKVNEMHMSLPSIINNAMIQSNANKVNKLPKIPRGHKNGAQNEPLCRVSPDTEHDMTETTIKNIEHNQSAFLIYITIDDIIPM